MSSSGSDIDVARARADTPACEHIAHFNNAGSSLPPALVVAAHIAHLEREACLGGYEAAAAAAADIARVYTDVAALVSAQASEIALVESATEGWVRAFYGVAAGLRPGDRILTGEAEYASNFIAFLQVARRTGAIIEVIPSDGDGLIDVEALERMLAAGQVRLVAVTHAPTNGGLINPAAAIGALTRRAGVLYLLDACQSIGQLDIDVGAIGCDMLSATGRKYLRGPRGAGFLFVRADALDRVEPAFLDLHGARWVDVDRYEMRADARRYETFESSVAARLGLGAAVRYALGWGMPAIRARVAALAEQLRVRLADIPGVTVTDLGRDRSGIVCFAPPPGADPDALKLALRARAIHVAVTYPSMTRIDMERRGLGPLVRASVHYYNTEDEVERLCTTLGHLLGPRG